MTTALAGRQGKIRAGCTCPPETLHEHCNCGATKMDVSKWEYTPADDLSTHNFENFREGPPYEPITGCFKGMWDLPYHPTPTLKNVLWRCSPKVYHILCKILAKHCRRQRKAQRRYQHQKRKQ